MRPLPPKSPKTLERAALGGVIPAAPSVGAQGVVAEQIRTGAQEQLRTGAQAQVRTGSQSVIQDEGSQEDPTVQQWMRDKKISEDSNPTSWKLCLLGTISLALAIVTAFGARPVVAEFLLRTADSFLPFHVHRRPPAAVSNVHEEARKTALSGDMDRAVSMYKKAVLECDVKNPARPELLNDLGVALTASGNNVEASRYLKEAIQLNPNLIAAYNNLAVSQMLAGDKASAMSTLEDAVRIQPQNEFAALKLKRMWANSEERSTGAIEYPNALMLPPSTSIQHASALNERPSALNEHPSASSEHSSVSNEHPSTLNEQSSASSEPPTSSHNL